MGRIAWQVPVVAALGTLAIVGIGWHVAAIPALYLAAVAPELTRIDLAEHRLPNRLVVPGLIVGLASAGGSWITTGRPPLVPLVAALAFGGILFVLALAGGMGMGDVKLAAVIGLASPSVPIAIGAPLLAFLFGGVVGLVLLVTRGRGTRIAFGPFLLAGCFAALGVTPLVG